MISLFGRKTEKQNARKEELKANKNTAPVPARGIAPRGGISSFSAAEAYIEEHRAGVKILGTNAASCAALKEATDEVLARLYPGERSEHISDLYIIAAYGVMHTPALVIDGKVASTGSILQKNDIAAFLRKFR